MEYLYLVKGLKIDTRVAEQHTHSPGDDDEHVETVPRLSEVGGLADETHRQHRAKSAVYYDCRVVVAAL